MNKLKTVFCALFRHSNIEKSWFGYVSCARCGTQVGDTIGSIYKNPNCVGLSCACEECEKNLKKLTFVDTFLTPRILWIGQREEWKAARELERDEAMAALKARQSRESAEISGQG